MARNLVAALLMLAASASSVAHADTWAVVPVGIGEPPTRARAVADTSSATLETSGATVFQSAQLTHRVENELSQPFAAAPPELLTRLDQAEHDLAGDVAQRRYPEILATTRTLFDELRPHLAAIHRSNDASADLSNVCGYRVFAAEAADRSGEAAARECFELVPRFSPDRGLHLPEVLELVARVGGQLPAAIVVESSPDDPPNCTIRVNGVSVGQSPSARVAVPAGTYAVQLECGSEPGRVHRVQAGGRETSIRVRSSLDAALQSRPVALVYASSSALGNLAGDVAALGRAIGADRVLTVVDGPSGVVLRAFEVASGDGPARQFRETLLGPGSDEGRLRQSIAALASSELGDPARAGTPPTATESISPGGPVVLGVGAAALLVGAIVGGVALSEDAAFRAACPDLTACPPSTEAQFQNMRVLAGAADVLLVIGSVTAIVGLVLTLTLRERAATTVACGPTGCTVEGRF